MTVLMRPDAQDRRIVGGYIGHVLVGMGLLHLPAIATALVLGELNDAAAMGVGALLLVVVLAALVALILFWTLS